jgi:hypothetical protein
MASEPQPDRPTNARKPLPFEPAKSRKKPEKQSAAAPVEASVSKKAGDQQPDKGLPDKGSSDSRLPTRAEMAIPQIVSQRMARRMALFCGIPSLLGVSTFFVSYFIVTNGLYPLPNAAVVLVSMGFFGLGVLGLSYGVISASWDEAVPGSRLGWSEFNTNIGRLTEAWRSTRKKS